MKKLNIQITQIAGIACLTFLFSIIALKVFCQDKPVIQFSGMVYSQANGAQSPLPFVGIGILRTRHGTYSDANGFFSMAAQTGDTILFSSLGYKSQRLVLPSEIKSDRHFENITLEQDTFQLESAIVYSIPSKEHFRPEFLEMDVSNKLKDEAERNLAQDVLEKLEPYTPSDGRAGVSLYFSQESQKLYYDGQIKPQNIFSPLAWVEFFKALKRGEFKKKKKK